MILIDLPLRKVVHRFLNSPIHFQCKQCNLWLFSSPATSSRFLQRFCMISFLCTLQVSTLLLHVSYWVSETSVILKYCTVPFFGGDLCKPPQICPVTECDSILPFPRTLKLKIQVQQPGRVLCKMGILRSNNIKIEWHRCSINLGNQFSQKVQLCTRSSQADDLC